MPMSPMSRPVIHKVGDEFADRNMFLQVTLGLVSVCHRFAGLVLDAGPSSVPSTVDEHSDPGLDFVLGIAAFSSHAVRHLAALCEPSDLPPASLPAETPGCNQRPPRRLLA